MAAKVREIHRSAEVAHTAAQLYALVDDVPSYPQFLPWCVQAEVLERTPSTVLATLEMSLAGIHRSVTTRNVLRPPQQIALELVEGPFSHFSGMWQFVDLPAGAPRCRVSLDLSYALLSRVLAATAGPVLAKVADSLVAAFCQRAHMLYRSSEPA